MEHDTEERELEAISLIDQAEDLAANDDGDAAIDYYEKAANIYLDLGSYIKLDELYIRIAEIIRKFKTNIQGMYRLQSIIRKTEELKLEEISAKLLIQLGNVSYKMSDWETAAEAFEKASNYLYESDPDEYEDLSSILLLRAGTTMERSPSRSDVGKRLILKAVMKINKFDELYDAEEKRALHFLLDKNFTAAASKFLDIAKHFKKALDNLDNVLDEEVPEDTVLNVKARFIHFVAEYQALAALCLGASGNEDNQKRMGELSISSIELFEEAISLLKNYLKKQKGELDKEVLYRINFDAMFISIIQRLLEIKKVDPVKILLDGLDEKEGLVEKLKEVPYFKITERIEKLGIMDSLDQLAKTKMGHFNKIKNALIGFFRQ